MATPAGSGFDKPRSPVPATFDLAQIRCQAEQRLLKQIADKPDLGERLANVISNRDEAIVHEQKRLLTDTYRVDASLSPRLHRIREQLAEALHLVTPIDVFVAAHPVPNAFCVPSRRGTRLVMTLHSALFSLLSDAELLFVMGHEAGHSLFDHTRIPVIDFDNPNFSLVEMIRLRSLKRAQEISCDRIGLLACQDVHAASSALVKILCGLGDDWLALDEETFAKQFDELSSLSELTDIADGAATHPLMALRVKALLTFAHSAPYTAALGASNGRTTAEDLERLTDNMLAVVEPDLSAIDSISAEDVVNRFLGTGALAIVAADGSVGADEVKFLSSKSMKISPELRKALESEGAVEKYLAEAAQHAEVAVRLLSVNQRAGLIHQMCLVALTAGGMAEIETKVAVALAQMLRLPEEFYRAARDAAIQATETQVPEPQARPRRRKRRKSAPQAPSDEEAKVPEPPNDDAPASTTDRPTATAPPAEPAKKG